MTLQHSDGSLAPFSDAPSCPVAASRGAVGPAAPFPRDTPFVRAFARVCSDGFAQGWHEANGGNLSYRLTPDDVAACGDSLAVELPEGDPAWRALPPEACVPDLAGQFLLISRAGCHMRSVADDLPGSCALVQVARDGSAWRLACGLSHGGRPSSELPTHLLAHEVRLRASAGADRVVYHAHCPSVIALSTLLPADERTWTRVLWRCMTECVIVFPEGVGVVPWKVPGSLDIARASAGLLATHRAVVWTQHGMFATGRDFDAAFGLMHTIEKAASLYLTARAANGGAEPPFLVSDEQLRAVCASLGVEPNPACVD
jgi:rhamnulose-1-phosphate aldolase